MNNTTLELITRLRRELHRCPEISLHEHRTKATLMEFLQNNTTLAITDRGAWFYAVKKAENPTQLPIAFRADFDAVAVDEKNELEYRSQNEGAGHMCGHDGHSAALCGLAMELEGKHISRDVYLIFQHAEEIGKGAMICAQLIEECGIAEVFAFHNLPGVELGVVTARAGTSYFASRGMIISYEGSETHASAPEAGKNPAYALARLVGQLPKADWRKGLTLCTLIQLSAGKPNFGIAAGEGRLLLTLRGEYGDELDELDERIAEMAREEAARDKLSCAIEYEDCFPETVSHKESVERVRAACEDCGFKYEDMEEPIYSSEDFGYYTQHCSGAIFGIGSGINHPELHTPYFDYPDELSPIAVEVFMKLVEK